MWVTATVLYILIQCSPIEGQSRDTGGAKVATDLEEDMMYKQLSPEAFFAMKENQPPFAPLEQHPLAYLGFGKPGMRPGTGPAMRPGAKYRGPGMGPMGPGAPHGPGMGLGAPHGPGMGPGPPQVGPGMGPMGPGAPHMNPRMGPMGPGAPHMSPGMGPMGPGAPHMSPGMGPMGHGAPHLSPSMGPMGPGAPLMGPGMRPMGLNVPHMGPGMRPRGPGAPPTGPAIGPVGPGAPPVGPSMGPMKPGLPPGQGPDSTGRMDVNMGVLPPDGMRGYEHFDLSILDGMSRQERAPAANAENWAEIVNLSSDRAQNDELIIYNLCFAISYIWRRGRESIRKYFHLRDLYHNHLPFEVGYITHVIMSKYETMLELYEYAATLAKEKKNTITRLHMTHFQKTMVEDGLIIQHMANMLHELKNKYAFQEYDPGNRFDIPPKGWEPKSGGSDGRTGNNQGYIDKKIEATHKVLNDTMMLRKKKMQQVREFYKKHGYLPTTTVKQQPMRLWSPNLNYGWSGEEDW